MWCLQKASQMHHELQPSALVLARCLQRLRVDNREFVLQILHIAIVVTPGLPFPHLPRPVGDRTVVLGIFPPAPAGRI